VRGGAECLTRQQIDDRAAAEKLRRELEAEERKRKIEAERAAAVQRELERKQAIERKKQEAIEQAQRAAAAKAAEAEAKKKAEAEAKQRAEDAKRANEALLKSLQEEKQRRLAAEADAKRKAEAEAKQKAEDAQRLAAEAEAIRKADELAKRRREEDAKRLAAELAAKQKAEAAAQAKADRERAEAEQKQRDDEAKKAALLKGDQAKCQSALLSRYGSSNAYVISIFCDPNQDITVRKIAAYGIGIDPNLVGLSSQSAQANGGPKAGPRSFSADQLKFLRDNVATLAPRSTSTKNVPVAPPSFLPITANVTGFRAPPVDTTQPNDVWSRLERAAAFANSAAATDPNFKEGIADLKKAILVEGAGCAAGALVGAVTTLGIGIGAGCYGGAVLASQAATYADYTANVATGINAIHRRKLDITLPEAAKDTAEYFADKGSDYIPGGDLVPISPIVKAGGSWITYFGYAFYNNVPGP
jgi:chemotaxis protein histidine kinase CheA